jgi:hypothetical protein
MEKTRQRRLPEVPEVTEKKDASGNFVNRKWATQESEQGACCDTRTAF